MESLQLAQHTYSYLPGQKQTTNVLFLLHGTGGNHQEMLQVGQQIDQSAHLISVQGNVLEQGMSRFFRRLAEGIYDQIDLARRTEELHMFVSAAIHKHQLEGKQIHLVGYSNGANLAISLALKYPKSVHGLILYRPFYPTLPQTSPILDQTKVLLLAGQVDPLTTQEQTDLLISALKDYKADVTAHILPTGHQLTEQDIAISQKWLRTKFP